MVKESGRQSEAIEQKGDFMLNNKVFLFALVVCAFSNAAMVGDFAPMKVGNKWVYSYEEFMLRGGLSLVSKTSRLTVRYRQ